MLRRSALLLVWMLPQFAVGQVTTEERSRLLVALAGAIGAAADAVAKLARSFETATTAPTVLYGADAAKRERERLLDLSRRTAGLIAANMAAIDTLEDYMTAYERGEATQGRWKRAIEGLGGVLNVVRTLLSDVQKENGDFVLDPAFLTLNEALAARSSLIAKIANMPAPATPDEVEHLRSATERYKMLVQNTRTARSMLNTYIEMRTGSAAPGASGR